MAGFGGLLPPVLEVFLPRLTPIASLLLGEQEPLLLLIAIENIRALPTVTCFLMARLSLVNVAASAYLIRFARYSVINSSPPFFSSIKLSTASSSSSSLTLLLYYFYSFPLYKDNDGS